MTPHPWSPLCQVLSRNHIFTHFDFYFVENPAPHKGKRLICCGLNIERGLGSVLDLDGLPLGASGGPGLSPAAAAPAVLPGSPPSHRPQTCWGHCMSWMVSAVTRVHRDLGNWVLCLFSELVSCIIKGILALDTRAKRKKEQSQVHIFWPTWLPSGPLWEGV